MVVLFVLERGGSMVSASRDKRLGWAWRGAEGGGVPQSVTTVIVSCFSSSAGLVVVQVVSVYCFVVAESVISKPRGKASMWPLLPQGWNEGVS